MSAIRGRGVGGGLDDREQLVDDVRDGVPTGEIEDLEGPGDGEPPSEAGLDDLVDVLGRRDALVDDRDGLPEQGELHPVANEPEGLLLEHDWTLAQSCEQGGGGVDGLVGGVRPSDNLDEREQVGRVPPVGHDDLVGPVRRGCQLAGHEGRGVARQYGTLGRKLVQPGKDLVLEFHILEHGFDDEVDVGNGLREGGARVYFRWDGGSGVIVCQPDALHGAEADIDVFEGPLQALVGRVVQVDVEASQRKVEGDSVAHETGSDDPDPRDVVGVHGCLQSVGPKHIGSRFGLSNVDVVFAKCEHA